MSEIIARRFLISGLVQGVGYRYFAQRAAATHRVTGFVRNLEDGRVEALVQGTEKNVSAMREDLSTGPRYGNVEHIEELVVEPDGSYSNFRIER